MFSTSESYQGEILELSLGKPVADAEKVVRISWTSHFSTGQFRVSYRLISLYPYDIRLDYLPCALFYSIWVGIQKYAFSGGYLLSLRGAVPRTDRVYPCGARFLEPIGCIPAGRGS